MINKIIKLILKAIKIQSSRKETKEWKQAYSRETKQIK